MEVLFVFLATTWFSMVPSVYVADYGLTGEDCIRLLIEADRGARVVAADEDGREFSFTVSDATFSCEVDYGV